VAEVRSEVAWPQRALARFPDGSNDEFGLPAEQAVVLERGKGCQVWDTAGRRYLDLSMPEP
jgi:glutamate-1-semialdehyde aminotransferase